MRMSKQQFEQLKVLIEPLITVETIALYETGQFKNAEKTKDLNMRFRWDLLWLVCKLNNLNSSDFFRELDNSHIDTALRKIVPTINREY